MLELDELWSFVGCKENKVWIWIALCRRTRQVMAWMWGDHSTGPCSHLWGKVPPAYRECHCFADGWEAYAKVIPEAQLSQQEKKGPTTPSGTFQLYFAPKAGAVHP